MTDALPARIKRALWRGDSRTWTHTFTTVDGPVDLTGHAFVSQYRTDLNRGEIVATATCEVIDATNGVLAEKLPAGEADKLPGQTDPNRKPSVYWDLQSTDADGNVRTWLYAVRMLAFLAIIIAILDKNRTPRRS